MAYGRSSPTANSCGLSQQTYYGINCRMSVNLYAQPVIYMVAEILLVPIIWGLIMYLAGKKKLFASFLNLVLLCCIVWYILQRTLLGRTAEIRTSFGNMPFQLILKALTENREIVRSLLLNILLFCPFGASVACLLPRKIPLSFRVLLTGLIGMILSVLIEWGQYRYSLGNAEADDVICNTLGALVGALSLPVKKMFDRHKY